MKSLKSIGYAGAGALGAVAITIGGASLAGAQEEDPTLDTPDVEAEEAPESNDGRRARRGFGPNAAARLVEEGVITQDQADTLAEVREAVQAEREARKAEKLQGIADVLGITVEDLQAAREEGTTLAELAGDDLDALVDHLVSERTAKIQEKVDAGAITQEQADEKIAGLDERITNRLENGGERGERGARGQRGARGGAQDAPAEEISST